MQFSEGAPASSPHHIDSSGPPAATLTVFQQLCQIWEAFSVRHRVTVRIMLRAADALAAAFPTFVDPDSIVAQVGEGRGLCQTGGQYVAAGDVVDHFGDRAAPPAGARLAAHR